MPAPEYARVAEILARAHALAGEARAAFLVEACGGDAALRAEVDALLAHEADTPSVLATSGLARALTPEEFDDLPGPVPADPPEAIGPYRILDVLGEGGMGTVYRAEQLEPIARRVAIKLIRRGLDTDRIVARFAAERRALARMDHPSIARVIDAGASADGRPYFVMELVEGQPITTFCDERHLSLRARLDLFLAVGAGVQHAHQRGIIHRDLKPSNILVRQHDGRSEPKVIDFGIQKAITGDDGRGPMTDAGVVGTPDYMSPEQAGVVDADTDTRSDVYSLGALLYELATGRRPHDLRTRTPLEVLRILRDQLPARPSVAARAAAPDVCAARKTTAGQLARQIAGDLDSIVLRAMATRPDQRYESVERFADDIQRHLAGRPILARDASWIYVATRFVGRHRLEVGAALLILALLIGFSANTWVQSRRIAEERDRAIAAEQRTRTEALTSQRTADFLIELFGVSDPNEARGNSVTARELLDRGAARIRTDLQEEPEVQATLMNTMGSVYRRLGLYQPSTELLEAALATRRRVLGDHHPDVAASLHNLARVLRDRRDPRAEALIREAVEIRKRVQSDRPELIAESQGVLGQILNNQGKLDEAEALYRDSLARLEGLYGPDDWRLASTLNNLASLSHDRAAYADAEPLYRRAIALERAHYGDNHPEVAITMNNLGSLLEETGRAADAEPMYVESLRIRRANLGDMHPGVATALNNLAGVRVGTRPAEAAQLYREALVIHLKMQGERHPLTVQTNTNLARALHYSGEVAEADRLYSETLGVARALWPKGHTTTAAILLRRGQLLDARGLPTQAEAALREALAMRRALLAADHPQVADAQGVLGAFLTSRGQFGEAEPLLVASHHALLARFGSAHPRSREASARLAAFSNAAKRPAVAAGAGARR